MKKIFLNDYVILVAIILNAGLIFLLTFDDLAKNSLLNALDYGFIAFFILEIVAKTRDYGLRAYFSDGWNVFDFIIVMVSSLSIVALFVPIPHLSFILVFRTGRLFRFFCLIKFVPCELGLTQLPDEELSLFKVLSKEGRGKERWVLRESPDGSSCSGHNLTPHADNRWILLQK